MMSHSTSKRPTKAPSALSPTGRRDLRERSEAAALAEIETAAVRQREKSARLRALREERDAK